LGQTQENGELRRIREIEEPEMSITSDNLREDLVLSLLAVNQYSLEKTYSSLNGLRNEGLFEPENLMTWTAAEIATRLKRAGVDRGIFMTTLFSERLSSLGQFLKARGIREWESLLLSNDTAAIRDLLLPVNGVGPKVLRNFFILRGI
jgi:hypothetical protein